MYKCRLIDKYWICIPGIHTEYKGHEEFGRILNIEGKIITFGVS